MITSLSVLDFCGFSQEYLHLHPRQIIVGENGSGKTHILESIHIASGGAFHGWMKKQETPFTISIGYDNPIGKKYFSLEKSGKINQHSINGVKITKKKYHETLPYKTVYISPFDMNLLYFAPSMRREWIDEILERTFSQFHAVKREYETIMRQRNALLKKIRDGYGNRKDLDYWDTVFSEKATLYSLYREKWCQWVSNHGSILSLYLPKYELGFIYESDYYHTPDREAFIIEYLRNNRERDILTGHTHIGPHLDDFGFLVSGEYEAHLYLSRGEMKMLLLSLKQLEINFLKKYLDLPIVLLFDDLFAELDMKYAERVLDTFAVDQIILTSQREIPHEKKWEDFACINLSPG